MTKHVSTKDALAIAEEWRFQRSERDELRVKVGLLEQRYRELRNCNDPAVEI